MNSDDPTQESPSPPPGETIRDIRNFVELMAVEDTPLTNFFQVMRNSFARPDYCQQHVSEPVEPEHSHWVRAEAILWDITPEDVDENPWWTPTQAWRDLSSLVADMKTVAFRKIPNPEYDEEACNEWKEEHGVNQRKVEWGMSSLVNDEARKIRKEFEENFIMGGSSAG